MRTTQTLIQHLGLICNYKYPTNPHPEGGWYRELQ